MIRPRSWIWNTPPLLVSTVLAGLSLGVLFLGIEPIGSDPDQMYRPIKQELARALGEARLPYWSERLGLGVPLVAESHVAAFYPPNWLLYQALSVEAAYRLAMWLHHVALAAATYFYARTLGIQPWGAALAGLAFTLCGFQAIHAIHEPFYQITPYLCLILGCTERYFAGGRPGWLGLLALAYGAQLTLGHFQLQAWTAVLVLVTGGWRVVGDGRSWQRFAAVGGAVVCGAAIAAVQLGPSWELMSVARAGERPTGGAQHFFSFPPAHWSELAVPRQFRGLREGVEDRYWLEHATTAREACLYIGTVPLVLAFPGWGARNRALSLWRFLVPASFLLATIPQWWPAGHDMVLRVPILGAFRAPARQTLLTSLGLCLFAGAGFDRSASRARFGLGLAAAVLFSAVAAGWALDWSGRSSFHTRVASGSLAAALTWAGLSWTVAVGVLIAWRVGKLASSGVLVLTAVELGLLYFTGPTTWGRPLDLRHTSPVLKVLAEARATHVAGFLRNLPLHVGVASARAYLGFRNLPPYPLLEPAQSWELSALETTQRRLRRFSITHGAWDGPIDRYMRRMGRWKDSGAMGVMSFRPDQVLYTGEDPALDRAVPNPVEAPLPKPKWRVVHYPGAFPPVRVATRALVAVDETDLTNQIDASDDPREVWFLRDDLPREDGGPRARSVQVVWWDGTEGEVEHDGTCELVLARTCYPGWLARVDHGPERPVLRVDGGLQAVRLLGTGRSKVTVRYQPNGVFLTGTISVLGLCTALAAVVVEGLRSIAPGRAQPPGVPESPAENDPARGRVPRAESSRDEEEGLTESVTSP
jgi:hypothetical protein